MSSEADLQVRLRVDENARVSEVLPGSWAKTLLKVTAMGVLYFAAFVMSVVLATSVALARF